MSVSGLKAELKFLESIFDKDHERFRIVSWKLDEQIGRASCRERV